MEEIDYQPNPQDIKNVYHTQWGDVIFVMVRTAYSVFDLHIYQKSSRRELMRCELFFWEDCEFFGHDLLIEFIDSLDFYQDKLITLSKDDLRRYVSRAMAEHPSSNKANFF